MKIYVNHAAGAEGCLTMCGVYHSFQNVHKLMVDLEIQDIKSGLSISLFKEKAKNKKAEGLKNEHELCGLIQSFPCFCAAGL